MEVAKTICVIDWALLLEYLKVALSWPPIVLVILLILITKHRPAIDSFLNRLVEGNFLGQSLKAAPPAQQNVAPPEKAEDRLSNAAAQATVVAATGHAAGNATAQGVGEAATQQAEHIPPDIAQDPQAMAALEWVRANPAQTVIEYKNLLFNYNSERLFTRIYGTQLALLEYLQSRVNSQTTLPQLVRFHEEHQRLTGKTVYPLDAYIDFLKVFGVIAIEGPENAKHYRITEHGVKFLSYIKAQYPEVWNQRAF